MTRKIGDIQVLWALAILFVIIHHAYINLITWNTPAIQRFYAYFAGEVGVDLFFVISGFVIARNFLPRLIDSKKNFSTLVEFWVKRFFRNTILLVLLVCLATVLSHELHIASGNLAYNLAAIISAILVFIASFNSNYILRDGLIKRLLIWLGDRSYALYLTHMPAFFLTRELFHRVQPELVGSQAALIYHTVTAATLMLLFAEFSYRFIETPLQKKGAKLLERRRQQLSASSAGEVPHVQ